MFLVELDHRNIGNEHKHTSEQIEGKLTLTRRVALFFAILILHQYVHLTKSLDGGFGLTIFLVPVSPPNKIPIKQGF